MVMAESSEAAIQNTMVMPRGLKNCPESPLMKPRGRNTTQVVRVDPKTEAPTVRTPFTEAFT